MTMFTFLKQHKISVLVTAIGCSAIVWTISLYAGSQSSVEKNQHKKSTNSDTTFTLLFGGDMMGHQPMINAAWNDSTQKYEYLPWFQFIQPIVNQATWSCANLEVTLAGPPYSGYPQFSSPDDYAAAIQQAGFDFLVTANNHSQDRGKDGLERTISVLDSLKIPHTGTFIDTGAFKQSHPAVVEVAGCKIAILNYTYGTNGLVVKHPNMVNMIDTAWMDKEMKKAKQLGVDLIIPVMHWGVEYMTTENADQRKTAEFLATRGANAIIGMHPHVVQPIKYVAGPKSAQVPVAFSLGNFVSNQRDINRDGGIMVQLTCKKIKGKVSVQKVSYIPFWVWRLQETNPQYHLRKGYYILTEKQVSMLTGEDKDKATLFFSNVRKIVNGPDTHRPIEEIKP